MMSSNGETGTIILRFGLAALFLWFGISQITDAAAWVVWVPEWATGFAGLSDTQIVLINGSLETLGGMLLVLGLWIRVVAFLLALHLFSLSLAIGLNDIGVRDFALGCASLALAFFGADRFTVDARMRPPSH